MSKPNESRPGPAKRPALRVAALTGLALAAIAGVLLQMPRGAEAGIATGADDHVAAQASARKGPGTYQLRCWQYGRLLFDEGPVTLGPETRQGAKLVAVDRNGGTLIVTDSGWTTCLARPSPAPRSLALPR